MPLSTRSTQIKQQKKEEFDQSEFFSGFAIFLLSVISVRFISLQTGCVSVSLRAPPAYSVHLKSSTRETSSLVMTCNEKRF